MSNKLMLTKFALSTALLVSIVANPAITNAANTTKNTQVQTFQKTILSNAFEGTQMVTIANSFSNPLDLAKKYAPDTVEDWTKTLALYEKTIGTIQTNIVSTIEAVNLNLEGSENITLPSTAMSSSTLAEVISAEEIVSLGGSISISPTNSISSTDSVSAVNLIKTEIMMDEANDPHQAFFRVKMDLEEAVKSKDTTAIKQTLAKLLEQYKSEIAQSESKK
ncbi:hypothetical protein [Paenibacillus endoradicis]|uniref:hypothetical protein n=1 Tax=Paenibacillus endoradicis TaxID=2972487 RepID=UPI0021590C5E|nr:hypothetical protein [Paenibacillus endoradicis]MCR8659838.1 hypothetical protein [Paenibacillus endoradicis]